MTTIGDTINFKLSTDVLGSTLDVLSKANVAGVYVRTYDIGGESINRLDLTADEALDLAQALILAATTSQRFRKGIDAAAAAADAKLNDNARSANLKRNDQPRFKPVPNVRGRYQVWSGDVLCGEVQKREDAMFGVDWVTFYNDGSAGYGGDTRIDAAWRLINS